MSKVPLTIPSLGFKVLYGSLLAQWVALYFDTFPLSEALCLRAKPTGCMWSCNSDFRSLFRQTFLYSGLLNWGSLQFEYLMIILGFESKISIIGLESQLIVSPSSPGYLPPPEARSGGLGV